MGNQTSQNPDALPQPIGEFRPVDEWQAHIAHIFYAQRAGRLHEFYQTFATADYRLAHALATDYYQRVRVRDKGSAGGKALTVMEWGCGNGNLAACFLSHLRHLDTEGAIYPRVRYVLVDNQADILKAAMEHPDLAAHRQRVDRLDADAANLGAVRDGTVDRILCNELWNELPTKLMLKKGSEIEEEYIRPNLNEKKHAEIADWSVFVKAFEAKDIAALKRFPSFLEEIVWEREYRKVEWKAVPYRKTISEFLKQIDEQILLPINLGACATLKEAKRVLAPDAVGFSSFDAGTAEQSVLNDPEKPCYGQFGGQYSFMVNFALAESVAKHEGIPKVEIEPQREFVERNLNTNVLSLMDLLATYPSAGSLRPWQQAGLVLKTLHALNERYASPYHRKIDFPLPADPAPAEREALERLLQELKSAGVPDTVAYLTE